MKEVAEHHPGLDPVFKDAFRETCIDICRSTLELKQHSITDVLGGQEMAHRALAEFLDIDGCEDLSEIIIPEVEAELLQELRQYLAENQDIADALPYMLQKLNS